MTHATGALRRRAQPVIVWSHGRSGSTLLLNILGSDRAFWPIYEPLQEVRQLPPRHFNIEANAVGKCRDAYHGADTLMSACPMRDAALVVSALECNFLPLVATWYGELDLTKRKAAWMLHGNGVGGAGFTTIRYTPDLEMRRIAMLGEHSRGCQSREGTVAKVIRLNGELHALHNVSLALGYRLPLVLHLVRDPRAIYASRKRLTRVAADFGVPSSSATTKLAEWARRTCGATQMDAVMGKRLFNDSYEQVEYSDFVRKPRVFLHKLYERHFQRPVPAPVLAYLADHLPEHRSHSPRAYLATNRSSWQYMFGTMPRDVEQVDQAWRTELMSWEIKTIDKYCAGSPAHRRIRGHAVQRRPRMTIKAPSQSFREAVEK